MYKTLKKQIRELEDYIRASEHTNLIKMVLISRQSNHLYKVDEQDFNLKTHKRTDKSFDVKDYHEILPRYNDKNTRVIINDLPIDDWEEVRI